jgi:hypothetical protein
MDEHSSFYSSLAFLAKPMSVKILPSTMPSGVFQICILAAFISVIIVGEPQVANGQHGLDHPAVVIDFPSLECACDDSNASSTSSDREQGGDESSRGGTCKAGGQARWVLSVRGLVPGFSYRLHFKWSLEDGQLGALDLNISTTTSSYVVRTPLAESVQNGDSIFDLIAHSRKLRMDVAVWDVYPGLTEEEALIGARHMDSAVNTVRVCCTDFESKRSEKMARNKEDLHQQVFEQSEEEEEGSGAGGETLETLISLPSLFPGEDVFQIQT